MPCHPCITVLTGAPGNYLLGFLWNRGSELPNFVLNSIIKLLCNVTKLSWIADERQQAMPADVAKFLSVSALLICRWGVSDSHTVHP